MLFFLHSIRNSLIVMVSIPAWFLPSSDFTIWDIL
jgi:hypothetical protein